MVSHQYQKWLMLAPLMLPDLIGDNNPDEVKQTEDEIILTYYLEKKTWQLADVIDMLTLDMELKQLYIAQEQDTNIFLYCAFSQPASGDMFKVNCSTNSNGLIDSLTVHIYGSVELIVTDLEKDLLECESKYTLYNNLTIPELFIEFE